MFDKEVKIRGPGGTKETKPEIAKPQHHPFSVVGDRSAGAVMESKRYEEHMGTDTVIILWRFDHGMGSADVRWQKPYEWPPE